MTKVRASLAIGMILGLGLTGCAVNEEGAGASAVEKQTLNQKLHDALPEDVKSSGTLVAVNSGSFPPYTIIGENGKMDGATVDFGTALGELIGVQIEYKTVDGIASMISGLEAKRYSLDLGPVGDFKARQEKVTFVDWIQEHVVFAVREGNPEAITGLDSTCGKRVGVAAGGSAERVINEQSKKCVEDGKPAVVVQSYKDQPSSVLALHSGRLDAVFSSQAPLTYFMKQAGEGLELAGLGQANGFGDMHMGMVFPKDSQLPEVILEAMKVLYENGTYDRIMEKHGLSANKTDQPGINLGVS